MTYYNTSITERNLFRKLFESNRTRVSNKQEQSIILENYSIFVNHIFKKNFQIDLY